MPPAIAPARTGAQTLAAARKSLSLEIRPILGQEDETMPFPLLILFAVAALVSSVPASPARADWAYRPPPVGAVVLYDDGHSNRIDAVSGDRITVVTKTQGKAERLVYRTWLVRERFLGKGTKELFLDSGSADAIVGLWPLQPGESLTHSFRTEQDGKVLSTGMQTLSYRGQELVAVPAGTFQAEVLERRYVLTRVGDGQQSRGAQTTWHDAATGLILRVLWESDDASGSSQGSYAATAIELP